MKWLTLFIRAIIVPAALLQAGFFWTRIFFNILVTGKAVVHVEPNLWILTGELVTAVLIIALGIASYIWGLQDLKNEYKRRKRRQNGD